MLPQAPAAVAWYASTVSEFPAEVAYPTDTLDGEMSLMHLAPELVVPYAARYSQDVREDPV